MKKTIQVIGLVLISLLTIWNCKRDAITDYTEEVIIADQGGIVITQSGITLEIPEDAFENDGVVFLGKTGTEPTTVPNEDFTVVGESFTIKLPVDTLLNSITLKFLCLLMILMLIMDSLYSLMELHISLMNMK